MTIVQPGLEQRVVIDLVGKEESRLDRASDITANGLGLAVEAANVAGSEVKTVQKRRLAKEQCSRYSIQETRQR